MPSQSPEPPQDSESLQANEPPRVPGDPEASASRSLWNLLLAGLLIVAIGLVVDWGWGAARRARQPTGDAEWVWIRNMSRWSGPEAFYAVRDFEVDGPPSEASVVVMGDEEYILFLNGRRVGGNHYQAGSSMDRYDVTGLLTEGVNRLSVHLRSSRGEGAFLLALYRDGDPAPMLVTDGDWKVVRRWSRKLYRPWMSIDRLERVVVLADPPTGRWGGTTKQAPKPLHDDLILARGGLRPQRWFDQGQGWVDWRPRRPVGQGPRKQALMLDWGQVVSGVMTLRFDGPEAVTGLLYLGAQMPDPVVQGPDAYVIGTPGQLYWEDVVPRRFRYALLVGFGITDARIVPTDADLLRPIRGGEPAAGVLGLEAPRLRSTTEDKVWSELESLPR